jgi:hypothetical protein
VLFTTSSYCSAVRRTIKLLDMHVATQTTAGLGYPVVAVFSLGVLILGIGALDDVPPGKLTLFPMAVKCSMMRPPFSRHVGL